MQMGTPRNSKYAGPENDDLLDEVTTTATKARATKPYYEETTRDLSSLVDSAAGTFTATYDAEGKMTSEVYPNNMCANYKYNSVGEPTSVEYLKTAECSETKAAVWYSDTRVPSVRGETLSQTSTLASETYMYDTLGRISETQETPAGESCTSRSYTYDEESDCASLTTRKCGTEGGTTEAHNYDEANRLTDTGIAYDPLGNVTKLPGADVEGHELKSTFYVDNAVATQEQNGETNTYSLDPEGRTLKTVSTGKTVSTVISHYDGPGEAVAWTEEETSKKWTRDIPGIDGALAATETEGETAVLQLHDLNGDVAATVKDKTGETELLSKYNSTEFGAPTNGKEPPKYAWLGAAGVAKSFPSGVITYGATSYVPQTGRALQSQGVEPPGLPDGSGLSAPYTAQEEPWNMQGAAREGAEAPGLEAGREREAAAAALRACEASEGCDPPKSIYFDATEVAVICGVLNGEDVALEAVKIIELASTTMTDLEKDFFIEMLKEITGFHTPPEWATSIQEDLNACLGVMVSGHGGNLTYARCRITTPWSVVPILGFEVPDLFKMPTGGYCLYYAEHCGTYESSDDDFLFPSGKTL